MSPAAPTHKPRTARPLEFKLKVLADFDQKEKTGESLKTIAARHGCDASMIYYWDQQRKHGKLDAPVPEKGKPKARGPDVKPRKQWPLEFKQEAVRRYHARGTKQVMEVAAELGIETGLLQSWRKQGIAAADAPPTNGHSIVTAKAHAPALPKQQTLDLDVPATGLAQMRIAQLEHNNATLKRMLAIVMEQL